MGHSAIQTAIGEGGELLLKLRQQSFTGHARYEAIGAVPEYQPDLKFCGFVEDGRAPPGPGIVI